MGRDPVLVLRSTIGPGVGAGHLARCLALAATWRSHGGSATIVSPALQPPWHHRVRDAQVDWAGLKVPEEADWYVADDYRMTDTERAALRALGPLLLVDDYGESGTTVADLVLDQNAGATSDDYAGLPVLAGPRYVLLRAELQSFPARPTRPTVATVVVGLGGFPSGRLRSFSEAVLDKWRPRAEVIVLDGTQDVKEVLAEADLAFAASGSFCWELCRAGVPAVVVPLNRNQSRLAENLVRADVAMSVDAPDAANVDRAVSLLQELEHDTARRARMAELGRQLVDGRGATRVVTRLRSSLITLNDVSEGDATLLFNWANDAVTRAGSFNPSAIDWETHQRWLSGRLRDSRYEQLLAGWRDSKLGLVRFDPAGEGTVEIGITVAPDERGHGWAAPLIDAAVRRRFARGSRETVVARIRPENVASVRAFETAEFVHRGAAIADQVELERRYGGV